ENVRNSGLQFGDQTLRASTKEGIKDHRRDTDGEPGSGIEKGFTDAVRKLHIPLTANIRTQSSKRANNSDHRPKQTKEWRDHADIGEVGNAIIQIGSDPGSLSLG